MKTPSTGICAVLGCCLCLLLAPSTTAAPGVAPTAQFGMFFEFGDEAGISGGFTLFLGAAIYPSVDPDTDGRAFYLAPGLEFRTGLIPLLTGPTELSPQLRAGIAYLGPPEKTEDQFSHPDNLTNTDLKLEAIFGYRYAFAFGLDNGEGKRQDEQSLRFGLSLSSVGLLRKTDPFPMPNMLSLMLDANFDGTADRAGLSLGYGL